MNLSFYIAKRYLFSKKSHNAINVISMISVCGIIVATMAMVCTLSVFNGFTDLVAKSFSAFDPDLKLTAKQGKVFVLDEAMLNQIAEIPEVLLLSESLEENALLKFENRQEPIRLVGVSPEFQHIANIDTLLLDGEFALRKGDIDFGVIGGGLAQQMGAGAGFLSPLEIYIPKRNTKVNVANPSTAFKRGYAYVSGVFALNQAEYDDQMLLVDIGLMRDLLDYENEISNLDIKLAPSANLAKAQKQIKNIVGDNYYVKDRFQQQETLFKWVSIEKWITFLILALVSAIAIFNVVGSLSMLIIEKKGDIKILQSMGANDKLISSIFLFEGWLITFFGSSFGLLLGLSICLIQEHFGILKLAEGGTFIMDAYPISVLVSDTLIIFVTINLLGFLAIFFPVSNLRNNLREIRN